MMANNNLRAIVDDFNELERAVEMGYVDDDVAIKIDKFSKFTMANGVLRLAADFNNLSPFLDTPAELFLTSDSVADVGIEVTVFYIDQNRDMQSGVFILNGTNPVSLGTDIYCVWRMRNTNGANYGGNIYVGSEPTPVSGVPAPANTYGKISLTISVMPNVNQSLTGIFSIPRGYTGFITNFEVGADRNVDMIAAGYIRPNGGVYVYVETLNVYQTTIAKKIFKRIPELTDLRPLAYAQTGGAGYLDYTIILINNNYLDKFLRT